jgi:hypothetical protein
MRRHFAGTNDQHQDIFCSTTPINKIWLLEIVNFDVVYNISLEFYWSVYLWSRPFTYRPRMWKDSLVNMFILYPMSKNVGTRHSPGRSLPRPFCLAAKFRGLPLDHCVDDVKFPVK